MAQDTLPNTGVLIEPPLETDYIAGAESPIGYAETVENGDWRAFLPSEEHQKGRRIETMACVSYSAHNTLEIWFNYFKQTGQIPVHTLKRLDELGYIKDGELNLSDRFLAWKSETTKQGNYMNKVAQTLRTYGAVPEDDWPFVDKPWDEYYQEPPQWVQDKAERFKDFFEVRYEWVSTSISPQNKAFLRHHMKHAPLQVALATCSPWDENVNYCGRSGTNHAVTGILINEDDSSVIFDHYDPYVKNLSTNYPLPSVIKILLILKEQDDMRRLIKFSDTNEIFQEVAPFKVRHLETGSAVDNEGGWEKVESLPASDRSKYKKIGVIYDEGGEGVDL